jgi:hypothetical protein
MLLFSGKPLEYSDRTPAEVAEALGLSVNSVLLAKSRVIKRMRQELAAFVE